MGERVVKANGIDVWTEDFGSPADPAILLVMGATAQGILWPEEFCMALVAAGRYVIRFDNRDTGKSTCFDFATAPYALGDMARDAVGVLDAYGIARAHVVGASMGGMIAQTIAIEHPERMLSMTSIMSSPIGGELAAAGGTGAGLPGPEPRVLEAVALLATTPATNDTDRVELAVKLWRALAGSADPVDEAAVRERERRVLARARNIDAAQNHSLAIGRSPDRREGLRKVRVPTLVIHGTDDPILPLPHGKATADCVQASKLITIAGMGHDLPPRVGETVLNAIVEHTGGRRPATVA